jgi:XRE family transcriptional regulator, fatty acid utilization regulator
MSIVDIPRWLQAERSGMAISVPIGFRIKERRRALGMTQAGMARDLNISASYLNLIEANKRPIGGRLLQQIARLLDLDLDALTGESERRLIADLAEAAGGPGFRQLGANPDKVPELVARFPAWAAALRALVRTTFMQAETIAALSDRLSRDPALSDALYGIITHATAIRSTVEILGGSAAVSPAARDRFEAMVGEEAARLAEAAQAIVRHFERASGQSRPGSPVEEVDDYLIANQNYFPVLEEAAGALRRELTKNGSATDAALADYLRIRHGMTISFQSPSHAALGPFRNQSHFDPHRRHLVFLDNAAPSTRRFEMARRAAALFGAEAVEAQVAHGSFIHEAAHERARHALSAYLAGACLFPYDGFYADAERCRYDIEQMRQRYAGSFEQIAHRLVTLRRPRAEGVPFGFLRADPAGFLTKRFPLAGLPIPRIGTGCPLWAVYEAFQSPDRIVRQVVEFPDRARFLFIARTVTKDPSRFHETPFLRAVMLVCDAIHADRTVYADGLDISSRQMSVPVGPGCRLCTRTGCLHRAEDAILAR